MKSRSRQFLLSLAFSSSAVMVALCPLSSFAADFTWGGGTSSDWTLPANWTVGTPPVYGTSYPADTLRISNGAGSGAVYNPGSALTTTFGAGRAFILGSGTTGTLTVSSGTLAAARVTVAGNEALMANGASASLSINGTGAVDLTNHLNTFQFFNSGTALQTSNLTLGGSGAFSSNGFNFNTAGTGAGTVNLDGGTMAVTAFTRTGTSGSTVLNLNGGTLRIRGASSANFLPALTGLQTIVKTGGAVIDSNSLNLTIAEVLEHDTALGAGLDGGLTKNSRGNLTLSGNNTFNGGVTINAGTALAESSRIILGNNNAAGTGKITLAGSYSELQLGLNLNIANELVVSDTGAEKTLLFVNPGGAQVSGAITINETNIDHFRVRSDVNCNLTLSGKISGAGGIYKFQVGIASLTNSANDFTGGVKINQGTLSFANGALGTTGSILMDGGALRWETGNTQDVSGRIVMVDTKTAVINTNGNNVTLDNAIGNASTGSLQKTGAGSLTLSGTNTYTGTTAVNNGKLVINGNITASPLTTVASGATLGGNATVAALTVLSGGFVTPGNSSGTLTVIGNYIQAGTYTAEIDGLTPGTLHDQINVTGSVDITDGSLSTVFTGSYSLGDMIFLLLNDGADAITGSYTGLAQDAVFTSGGHDWRISYLADSAANTFTGGNDIALVAIPEPSAALLGGLGLLALLRRRR
jgi:autotransporter-associated beta strand protein